MSSTGDNAIFYLNHQVHVPFTLTNCIFTYCISDNSGGCIFVPSTQVILTLNGSQFFHCSAVFRGGAIAQVNTMYDGLFIITCCIFKNCTTTGSNSKGGAIYARPFHGETFVMNDTSFTSCTATPDDGGRGGVTFFYLDVGSYYFKFNGTLTFRSCNASKGKHFFFEYDSSSLSICDKTSFDYAFSTEECTIYMGKRIVKHQSL
jgi:hypothetical protein